MDTQIVLTAVQPALAEAWRRHCGDLDQVEVHQGSIFECSVDAVVSPANSFGFMDGGIDRLYSNYFGWDLQARLQDQIRTRHHGELLVGAAELVETEHAGIPFLIAAPTMRVPMILRGTVNPYLAARAVLLLIRHGQVAVGELAGQPVAKVVRRVAFPGLGTGVGRVEPDICARQVRAAIDEVVLGLSEPPQTWFEAQTRHQLLYGEHAHDLQRG